MLLYALILAIVSTFAYFVTRKVRPKPYDPIHAVPGILTIATLAALIMEGNVLFIFAFAFYVPAVLYFVAATLHTMSPKTHPFEDPKSTAASRFLVAVLFAIPCAIFIFWGMCSENNPTNGYKTASSYMEHQPTLERKNDRAWISLK